MRLDSIFSSTVVPHHHLELLPAVPSMLRDYFKESVLSIFSASGMNPEQAALVHCFGLGCHEQKSVDEFGEGKEDE